MKFNGRFFSILMDCLSVLDLLLVVALKLRLKFDNLTGKETRERRDETSLSRCIT